MVASILWIFKEAAMKVISVVGEGAERRTYVDGGPPCPSCNGTGWFDYNAGVPKMPCRDCDGTGLIPVELWPDAVKAERLNRNMPHPLKDGNREVYVQELSIRQPLLFSGEHYHWEVVAVSDPDDALCNGRTEVYLGESKDFSAALTAAVIAVAEEEK